MMKFLHLQSPKKIKYAAGSFFIAIGLFNLATGFFSGQAFPVRDMIILLFLSLPLLINKRLFYLGYGLLAAAFSIVFLFAYAFTQNPFRTDTSVLFFISGCLFFVLSLAASLALIYVGTYSIQKNTFRII